MEQPGRLIIPPGDPSLDSLRNDPPPQYEALITIGFAEALINNLRSQFPGVFFHHITARKVEDVPADVLSRIQVLYSDRLAPTPEQAPRLRWVQYNSAGIDFVNGSAMLNKGDLAVTSMSGAISPQSAEYILAALLNCAHHFDEMRRLQSRSEWPDKRWERYRPVELRGSTVAIVGYGSIGRELARLLQPFNCQILAVKQDVMHPEDSGYSIPGLGDPQGHLFTRLYPFQAIRSVLRESDFVVITLPLTAQTRGMFNADVLAAMKPGSFLVNMGRGGVVDETALANMLQEHRLGGAVMDVFSEEPLPATSPLWKTNRLLITPHIAGLSSHYDERALELFTVNLERFIRGERLLNLYQPSRGY